MNNITRDNSRGTYLLTRDKIVCLFVMDKLKKKNLTDKFFFIYTKRKTAKV